MERAFEDIHEPPDRHHDKEADYPVDDELLSFLALLLFIAARDIAEYPPDDDEDRQRHDGRYRRSDKDGDLRKEPE